MSGSTFDFKGANIGAVNADNKGPVSNIIDQRHAVTNTLAQELSHLEQRLAADPIPEAAQALQLTREAKVEVGAGNESSAIAKLKQGGAFLLDVAKEVSASVIVKMITGG